MAKLARRKDLKPVMPALEDVLHQGIVTGRDLDRIMATLADHGVVLARLSQQMALVPSLSKEDIDRVEALLDGVRVALERMGGQTMPSALTYIMALRDQLGEFSRELAGYRTTLMDLREWLDKLEAPAEPAKPKRRYNRRKKSKSEVEILTTDVASHNGTTEIQLNDGEPDHNQTP